VPDQPDLLGNSGVARASRLQRAYRRRAAAFQPDAGASRRSVTSADPPRPAEARCPADVAIDFVEMTDIVARMQAAFFADPR
jgi:hypothetical protein